MCKMMQITPIVMPSLLFFPTMPRLFFPLAYMLVTYYVVYLLLKQLWFVPLTVRNAFSNHVFVHGRSLEKNVHSGQRALLINVVCRLTPKFGYFEKHIQMRAQKLKVCCVFSKASFSNCVLSQSQGKVCAP